MRFQYTVDGVVAEVEVEPQGEGFQVTVNGHTHQVMAERRDGGQLLLRVNGQAITATTAGHEALRYVALKGRIYQLTAGRLSRRQQRQSAEPGDLTASMPGQVIAVHVQVGDTVQRGAPLVVLEAMKMEQRITAPADGTVTAVHCAVGDVVERGQPLVELDVHPPT